MVAPSRRCTYDGVTEGNNVTTSDVASGSGDPLDVVSGTGSGLGLAAAAILGAKGVRFSSTAGESRFHQFTHATSVTTLAVRAYFRIRSTTATSGDVQFLDIRNSNGATVAALQLKTDKSIDVHSSAVGVQDNTGVLATGVYTVWLCAVRGTTSSNGQIIVLIRKFTDGSQVYSFNSSTQNLGTTYNLNRVRLGKIVSDAITLTDLDVDDLSYLDGSTVELDYTTGTKQISVGQDTSTMTAQTHGRKKSVHLGQATGATSVQSKSILQVTETDLAQTHQVSQTSTRILRRVGIYNSDQQESISQITTEMGQAMELQSHYALLNEGWSANVTKFKSWIDQGVAPCVSKASNGSTMLNDYINGVQAAIDWVDLGLTNMQTVAAYGKTHGNVPVYYTIDQEWSVRVNSGGVTGADATATVAGEFYSQFFERAHAIAPDVKPLLWLAGFNSPTDLENPLMNNIRSNAAQYMYAITGDPYANGATDNSTLAQTLNKFGNKLRTGTFATNYNRFVANGFTGYVGITEYGISTPDHSALQVQNYYNPSPGIRQIMETNDYIFCTFFNSDAAKKHMITSGGTGAPGAPNPTACTNFGAQIAQTKTYKIP